ncbi:MAG TPA: BTAD domain-containing putative transcriptional regulator [Pusillimonas sp.]|uniref:BTAD domain-containing putative transcriptional regulator n=1 Tax=Pusillimonas sp. TaxID=3040095 RepID=UPI002CF906CE|nr:BTAD domain-containing putative transcriptional regulator [Pusillimonas sp.]HUH87468.1 BTAD domain-containing putative transcriptional regulator [Pusillimonas sp.]
MVVLNLLGPFHFSVDHSDHTSLFSYDKVKVLAAVLCLADGKAKHRDSLAQMLWPDLSREKALSRLRHALHVLRKALGSAAPLLHTTPEGGLAIRAGVIQVDVLSLLAAQPDEEPLLRERLRRYGGPFLAGIKYPDQEVFGAWRQSWVDRIALELLRLRSRWVELALASEQTETALAMSKGWVQQSPEQEAYHRLLIKLLVHVGERQAALQAYAQCELALRQHLGVEPNSETRRLVEAVGPGSPALPAPVDALRYRTVVTLAIALSWLPPKGKEEDLDADLVPDEAVAYLDSWHEQLVEIVRQHGAWLGQAGGSTLLAHLGFRNGLSAPVTRAVELACAIRSLKTPDSISIGQALHVSLAVVDEREVNANSLFGQLVVPLAWKAVRGEVLLSPQAAARLANWQIEQCRRRDGTYFVLGEGKWLNDPLYGCQQEFEQLVGQWTQSRNGGKSAVQINGHMGLGKSRLAEALIAYVGRDGGQLLKLDFDQSDMVETLGAFLGAVRRRDHDRAATLRPRFVQCMGSWFELEAAQIQELEARLADRDTEPAGPVVEAFQVLKAVASLFGKLRRPLLVVLDHADSLTEEAAACMADVWNDLQAHPAGLLMLVLSRRSLASPAFSAALQLRPLSRADADKALAFYARGRRLTADVRSRIRERGSSNPMFIKNMVHLMQFEMPIEYLPGVADQLLMELGRLDEDSRRVLFLAALWEQASLQGIAFACELPADMVESTVAGLVDRGLLFPVVPGSVGCEPVLRQALKRLIGKEERKNLYAGLARFLIQADQAEDVIAACFTDAQSPQAAQWWRRAIDAALQAGQTGQAADHLSQVLSSLQYMSDVELRRQFEHESYVTLGVLEISQAGPAAEPVSQAYDRAVSRNASPSQEDLPVLWGQWVMEHGAGRLPKSLACAKRLQELARRLGQSSWYGWGLYAEAQYLFWKGRPQQSELLLNEALLAQSQMAPPPSMANALGHHCEALLYSQLGLSQVLQGRFDEGEHNARHALELARQGQPRISGVIANIQMLRILYLRGQLETLAAGSQALLNVLKSQLPGSVWCAVVETYVLYCTLVRGEEVGSELERLSSLLPQFESSMPLAMDAFLCILARCHLFQGHLDRARQALDQVCDIAHERASSLLMPEVQCLRGDLAWMQSDTQAAQAAWALASQEMVRSGLYVYEGWIQHRRKRLPDLLARADWMQRQPGWAQN